MIGKYVGPASYTSLGEVLTQAILQSGCNLTQLFWGEFGKGYATSGGATYGQAALDLVNVTGTQQAIIHWTNQVVTHTHDIEVIGGLTTSEALFLDASQNLGKAAATNRVVAGSTAATTGGVKYQSNAAGDQAAAGGNYSVYTCPFILIGV